MRIIGGSLSKDTIAKLVMEGMNKYPTIIVKRMPRQGDWQVIGTNEPIEEVIPHQKEA